MSESLNDNRAECDECGEVTEFPLKTLDDSCAIGNICTDCHGASRRSEADDGDPDVLLEHHTYERKDFRRMVLKLPDGGEIQFTHDPRRGVWYTVSEDISYDFEQYFISGGW